VAVVAGSAAAAGGTGAAGAAGAGESAGSLCTRSTLKLDSALRNP